MRLTTGGGTEHNSDGIRSYAYHPGGINTTIWKHFDPNVKSRIDDSLIDTSMLLWTFVMLLP